MASITTFFLLAVSLACLAFMPPTLATRSRSRLPGTTNPWASPCSFGLRPVAQRLVTFDLGTPEPAETSLPRHMHEMQVAARRARETAQSLYEYILNRRLPNALREECEAGEPLQGMPQLVARPASATDRFSTLPEDFQRLSVVTVFLQRTTEEDITYHRQLNYLLRRVVRLLCRTELTSLTMEQTLHRDVTHDVMSVADRNLPDEGRRDRRNCRIIRDTFNILDSLYRWYWPSY